MFGLNIKKITAIILVAVIILVISIFLIFKKENLKVDNIATSTPSLIKQEILGKSVENRDIKLYSFGNGQKHILFVGGIHGGYEWNSVILAYNFIQYLNSNTEIIPANLTIDIIPDINPDALYKVIPKNGLLTTFDIPTSTKQSQEKYRFNSNNVDLNRNFDCKWKSESMWKGNKVSAGTKAFSEPESLAIKNYVDKYKPIAGIFWHSQSNAIYASECKNGILPETINIMNAYSLASGYSAIKTFDSYEITGDAEGWLASINIPAITVELKTHETIEWEKNLAGFKAILKYYNK